ALGVHSAADDARQDRALRLSLRARRQIGRPVWHECRMCRAPDTVEMALKGELEDLSFVDILQIVSLSHRSGRLRIEGAAGGEAEVGFREGQIVFARTWKTPPLASETIPATHQQREALTRRRVTEALRLMLGLSAGSFEFQAGDLSATSEN